MPIQRCSEQARCTLEEFYEEVYQQQAKNSVDPGKDMQAIISLINQLFEDTLIWGLTSHYRLILQNTDYSGADSFVIVRSIGLAYYFIEYLLPSNKRPWPYAYVQGEADSLEKARDYILIAMRESEGWASNEELKQLLIKYEL